MTPEEQRQRNRRSYRKRAGEIKRTVLTHYGPGSCACVKCGMADVDVLTLDHIDDTGADERRGKERGTTPGLTGILFYRRLVRLGLPLGFQTLCANCNLKKEVLRRRANRDIR